MTATAQCTYCPARRAIAINPGPRLTSLCRRTFLKRKGGLFKKAHELSVLCSVDVAVFVFGNNKKLYEYSSADMRDLIARYQFVSPSSPNARVNSSVNSVAAPRSQ